jgi:hypothetical protein
MANRFEMAVEYEDGREEEVTSDQRDCVAFEKKFKIGTPRAMDEMTFQFFRFITWHALKRQKRTDDTFDVWDQQVVGVEDAEADVPDPTKEEASDEST